MDPASIAPQIFITKSSLAVTWDLHKILKIGCLPPPVGFGKNDPRLGLTDCVGSPLMFARYKC